MHSKPTITMTCLALDGPVVVAVIVHSTFTIEQQTILACLQGQCAVGAFEELMAIVWMRVGLNQYKNHNFELI